MNLGVIRVKLRPLIPTDFSSVSRFRILLCSSTATFPFHGGASSPSLSVGASSRLRSLSGPGGPSYNTPLAFCRSKLPLASSLYKQSRPDNQHSSLLSEVLQFFYLLLLGGSVATTVPTSACAACAAFAKAGAVSPVVPVLVPPVVVPVPVPVVPVPVPAVAVPLLLPVPVPMVAVPLSPVVVPVPLVV
jgi:hypothetical protein